MGTAMQDQKAKLRALNDALRKHGIGGEIYATAALVALGKSVLARAALAVGEFNNFTPDNDPHGEHDYGVVEVDGIKIMFKIDYYEDATKQYGAEDPTHPRTCRVMTVGLTSDY